MIDLTGEPENPVGKFLLLSVVSRAGGLSVPSAVAVVEIE